MAEFGNRIVVLIDMDCFFCQVEAKLNPTLKGKAMAVVQYSTFGPGATIAVNYEARAFGVTKHMRGDEAKKKCPHIELVTVPPVRNKPDTSRYRNAGKQVIEVLARYCNLVERASVDEAYLDITDLVEKKLNTMDDTPLEEIKKHLSSSFVVGYCDDDSNNEEKRCEGIDRWVDAAFDDIGDIQARKLAVAGIIVEEFRAAIYKECEYRCSAGISYNKILAKLACGLHKPNRQTILPVTEVPKLYSSLPVNKVRNLGGKFGNIVVESLGCNVMADLLRYSLNDLQKRFDEKTGSWLYHISRGIDNEPVQARLVGKSIGSTKNFPGKQAITKLETLKYWIDELTTEIVERLEQDLEENQRRATSLTVSYHFVQDKKVVGQSRVCSLPSYKRETIAQKCMNVITKATRKPIAFIGLSATKFVSVGTTENIINFFKAGSSKNSNSEEKKDTDGLNVVQDEKYGGKSKDEENSTKIQKQKVDIPKENDLKLVVKQSELANSNTNAKQNNLMVNTDLSKTFNRENFKNSFFMNFLKDSKSSSKVNASNKKLTTQEEKESVEKHIYKINDNSSDDLDIESPDIFADYESQGDTKDAEVDENFVENKSDTSNTKIKLNAREQLQEIFPDLDNIDLSVVQLLPIELRREAQTYLKSKEPTKKIVGNKNVPKNSSNKLKSTKASKATIMNSTKTTNTFMKNFFIKNSSDSSCSSTMEHCPECHQMIKIEKLGEHADFHVAKNLQSVINQSLNNETQNFNRVDPELLTKRKPSPKFPKPNKKLRNIESFFT